MTKPKDQAPTEGKWEVRQYISNKLKCYVTTPEGVKVCTMDYQDENQLANAKLIVKAVNSHEGLLEALRDAVIYAMLCCRSKGFDPTKDENIIKWQQAIKEAEGDSHE